MLASTIPVHNIKFPCLHQIFSNISNVEVTTTVNNTRTIRKPRRRKQTTAVSSSYQHHSLLSFQSRPCSVRTVLARVGGGCGGGGGGGGDANLQQPSFTDIKEKSLGSSTLGDSYVGLFVRMLGLDNDPLDREQAIEALWKYSFGGKKCIDMIMQYSGCVNLTINLLKSESSVACEAAAGLLRSISSINVYRDSVAESGAIEEITGLLSRPSFTSEVKEQSICVLWNLSVDEKLRVKIANGDILPLLIKSLEDEDIKVKEAAGGVLANLVLSHSNHKIMVEEGVISKLEGAMRTRRLRGKKLQCDREHFKYSEGSEVIRKEARNALIELAKDEYYRILIIEEGLVPVPMIGAAAYKSFKPGLYSWPSLPDGTEIERTSNSPSRYGANELLLGLNLNDKNVNMEEAKMNAIVGRAKQQFLVRIGGIELEDERKPQSELPIDGQLTILPWVDGVARLVLILGLEDEVAIARAAHSIADASINEHMRLSFKEAGAIKNLVQLLDHNSDAVRLAATGALERLSISHGVCQIIEAEGVIYPLVNTIKLSDVSESLMEKTLDVLGRILDPSKEMKSKFYDGPVNGSKKGLDVASLNASIGLTGNAAEVPASETNTSYREVLLDSIFIDRLVNILKTSYPDFQRKAASILEFVTFIDPSLETIMSLDIESGLDAVFRQKVLEATEDDFEGWQPEKYVLEVEEACLAISAASRLLTKLLDSKQFSQTIKAPHFTKLLRQILKSNVPLHYKDWVAACLVKLCCLSGPNVDFDNPINMEVTIYETIPRLIEQMKSSFSPEAGEAAAVELNRIISEGVVDSTLAIASEGGIFTLVKLIEEGSKRGVEAGLAILYNLSMNSENHSLILAAGAVPALRRIVLSQRPQWTRALRLLRNLPI
ncbi:hypothetical protein Dsin_009108 [Dipteronia sinensis]|uniref:ARM repeat superfamily protein n=1 Tax=Dipteronia sinensis TaxID=43782 RepID=A0AAE0EBB2_9ROSI|nr:hypothetical protein Dsin_009108 [Dipteronia sinensis]